MTYFSPTIVASLILGAISIILMVLYLGKPSRYTWMTPLGIFWVVYLARVQIPSFFVYYDTGWYMQSNMYAYPLMLAVCPIFVFMGALVGGRTKPERRLQWWLSPITIPNDAKKPIIICLLLGLIAIIMHLIATGGKVPLFIMLLNPGEHALIGRAREESLKLLPLYITYPLGWIRRFALPLSVLCSTIFVTIFKRGWLLLTIVSFIAIFELAYSAHRGPIAFLMLMLFVLYFIITRKNIGIIKIFIGILIILSFPLTVNILKYGKDIDLDSILTTFRGLGGRIFWGTSWTVGAHVGHVPKYSGGFLYGRSIHLLSVIMGQDWYPLSNMVMRQYRAGATTGIANTCFVGDAWANFGWYGVVIYSFFVGMWLSLIESTIYRMRLTPATLAFAVIVVFSAWGLASGSLQIWLLSRGGGLIPLACLYVSTRQRQNFISYPTILEQSQ